MIGKNIKSFHQLFKMVEALNPINFSFRSDDGNVFDAVAVFVKNNGKKVPYRNFEHYQCDYMLVFNHVYNNVGSPLTTGTDLDETINDLFNKYGNVYVIPKDKSNYIDESRLMSDKVVLPKDYRKKFEEFANANKKQMSNVYSKYTNENDFRLVYLWMITNGNKNFFFWAVQLYFKTGISIEVIRRIMLWNDKYSQLTNKLSRGTITAYTNYSSVTNLILETIKLRRDKRTNDVISMFNTAQRKALKGITFSDRDYETLSKFAKLSQTKKINFIRKMSTIEDANEIMRQMSFLADVHFEWNKKSFFEFLENNENIACEVVLDKDDIVLLKVFDYETVKRIAKTTNWCISKDRKYWREYVEMQPNSVQYVLMDFSQKEDGDLSIVGFTSMFDRGIIHAHDFQNNKLINNDGRGREREVRLNQFIKSTKCARDIYSVLKANGVKLSDVLLYSPSKFKWDRESMFKYLNDCVDEYDYYIIYDDGNKMVLVCTNDEVNKFFGRNFNRHGIAYNYVIMFVDFTKKETDPERITYGLIVTDIDTDEDYCHMLCNIRGEAATKTFDEKLYEYGLPYDIICRKNDVIARFISAYSSFAIDSVKGMINDKQIQKMLRSKEYLDDIYVCLSDSLFRYGSIDYLNLFYDNGLKLNDVLGSKHLNDLVQSLVVSIFENGRTTDIGRRRTITLPDEAEISAFNEGRITDFRRNSCIGYYLIINRIIDEEDCPQMISKITQLFVSLGNQNPIFDDICLKILNKCYKPNYNDAICNIISYASSGSAKDVIDCLIKNIGKYNSKIRTLINHQLSMYIQAANTKSETYKVCNNVFNTAGVTLEYDPGWATTVTTATNANPF